MLAVGSLPPASFYRTTILQRLLYSFLFSSFCNFIILLIKIWCHNYWCFDRQPLQTATPKSKTKNTVGRQPPFWFRPLDDATGNSRWGDLGRPQCHRVPRNWSRQDGDSPNLSHTRLYNKWFPALAYNYPCDLTCRAGKGEGVTATSYSTRGLVLSHCWQSKMLSWGLDMHNCLHGSIHRPHQLWSDGYGHRITIGLLGFTGQTDTARFNCNNRKLVWLGFVLLFVWWLIN